MSPSIFVPHCVVVEAEIQKHIAKQRDYIGADFLNILVISPLKGILGLLLIPIQIFFIKVGSSYNSRIVQSP
jgi:hypothetical protein